MTKKTRVRLARIAAGTVIVAGASLTAAGAAQAVNADIEVGPLSIQAQVGEEEDPCAPGSVCEDPNPADPNPANPNPANPNPANPNPADPNPANPNPANPNPADPNPANPNPANPNPANPNPANPDPTNPGEDTTGGNNGGSSTDGGAGTCTVDLDGAECVDNNPGTNNAGSQPVEQGKAKEELAETGAAETTFLIIGAATMIAGGIGFRMLPRLVAGGRAAV